jgi:hypothetical protein
LSGFFPNSGCNNCRFSEFIDSSTRYGLRGNFVGADFAQGETAGLVQTLLYLGYDGKRNRGRSIAAQIKSHGSVKLVHPNLDTVADFIDWQSEFTGQGQEHFSGSAPRAQDTDIGQILLEELREDASVLLETMGHDHCRVGGTELESEKPIRWKGEYVVCFGKACMRGEIGAAIGHGDVPAQLLSLLYEGDGIVACAEDK